MKIIQNLFKIKRRMRQFFTSRTTRRVARYSYRAYRVIRIINNPFLILESANIFNVLKLIGDRAD